MTTVTPIPGLHLHVILDTETINGRMRHTAPAGHNTVRLIMHSVTSNLAIDTEGPGEPSPFTVGGHNPEHTLIARCEAVGLDDGDRITFDSELLQDAATAAIALFTDFGVLASLCDPDTLGDTAAMWTQAGHEAWRDGVAAAVID